MGSWDIWMGIGLFFSSGYIVEKGFFGVIGGLLVYFLIFSLLSGLGGFFLLEKFEFESGVLILFGGFVVFGDELDKMESLLVVSELFLFIEDLLEYEKKEL